MLLVQMSNERNLRYQQWFQLACPLISDIKLNDDSKAENNQSIVDEIDDRIVEIAHLESQKQQTISKKIAIHEAFLDRNNDNDHNHLPSTSMIDDNIIPTDKMIHSNITKTTIIENTSQILSVAKAESGAFVDASDDVSNDTDIIIRVGKQKQTDKSINNLKNDLSGIDISIDTEVFTGKVFFLEEPSTFESNNKKTNASENKKLITEVKAYSKKAKMVYEGPKHKKVGSIKGKIKQRSSQLYVSVQYEKSVFESLSKDVCHTCWRKSYEIWL